MSSMLDPADKNSAIIGCSDLDHLVYIKQVMIKNIIRGIERVDLLLQHYALHLMYGMI